MWEFHIGYLMLFDVRVPHVFSQFVKTSVVKTSHQPVCTHNQMCHRHFLYQKQHPKFDQDEICATVRAHYTFTLKEWQLNSMEAVLNGKDVIVTAPTGGGKTHISSAPIHCRGWNNTCN